KRGMQFQVSIVDANPAVPIRGDNAWTLGITDEAGAPVTDVSLRIEPRMPDHGHGTPVQAEVTPLGAEGHFLVEPLNLFMAGLWEVRFDLTDAQGVEERIVFAVCVD